MIKRKIGKVLVCDDVDLTGDLTSVIDTINNLVKNYSQEYKNLHIQDKTDFEGFPYFVLTGDKEESDAEYEARCKKVEKRRKSAAESRLKAKEKLEAKERALLSKLTEKYGM